MLRRSSDSQWWPRVSVGTKILPRLLGTFRAEWPGIRIGLRESRDSAELIHAVETGDIDATFIDIGPYETTMIGTRNPGCRRIIDDCFRQAPVPPNYVFRSDDHPTIQGLIGSGLAYAVLPLLTVDEHDPTVGHHPHPARAPAPPARDRMAPRAPAAAGPLALCRGGDRDLPRPRRAVGGVASRVITLPPATPWSLDRAPRSRQQPA